MMNLKNFLDRIDFYSKGEVERVKMVAFYFPTQDNQYSFSIDEMCNLFTELALPLPNKSRLKKNITSSRFFVKTNSANYFRLHKNEYLKIKQETNLLPLEEDEQIICIDTIIYSSIYSNTRGYIEKLAIQINASYENKIYDGCAVLMRRLFEILLIHTYEHYQIGQEIKDGSGNYKMLSEIVKNAKNNSTICLSRDTKEFLDGIREIGNYSAHRIHYNARKRDIDNIVLKYRLTIEELLYKSGILI